MKQAILLLGLLALSGCGKDIVEGHADNYGQDAAANATLQVTTRGTGDAEVAYPVQVYVFQDAIPQAGEQGSGTVCQAVQTIGSAGQTLNVALTEGTYTVYAIGGASSADYTLPTKDDATTTTALTLKEGRTNGDLMTASATATLTDGGTNTVTLGLQRKSMLLQDVSISKVPSAATAVSVTIAPLWQSLTVGGTYAGTSGSQTVALTRQADGQTWTAAANASLLPPSSQPASISVGITIDGTTKTYTYSTSDQLEAGYKINISGTYTEAVGVALTGTISGATWLGERTISFNIGESGSSASAGNSTPAPTPPVTDGLPAVGDTYQGCYVLASDLAADGGSAELTLLSPTEAKVTGDDDVTAKLATLGAGTISGWDVPTKAQMELIEAQRASISGVTDGRYYLWRKMDGNYCSHRLGTTSYGTPITTNWPTSYDIYLRPVAEVTVAAGE